MKASDRFLWEHALAQMLGEVLGVPDQGTARIGLMAHPVVGRALELMGAVSTATSEDIEAHRPQFSLAPQMEQAAQRVASAAEQHVRQGFLDTMQRFAQEHPELPRE